MKLPITNTLLVLICSIAMITFLAGMIIGFYINKPLTPSQSEEMRLNSNLYFFINPLLDKVERESDPLLNREIEELKSKIEELTTQSIDDGHITAGSVYYRDLNNGPWFSINNDHEYKAASLLKIPVMIAFFKLAEEDPKILNKEVTYETAFENTAEHHVEGTDVTIELGKTYTINELIERMIIYSDNIAAYLLLEQIDEARVAEVFDDFAVPDWKTPSNLGPRTYASFLRILYNATYLNEEYSEKALEILSRSTFSHGMRSALLKDVKASIKYGISNSVLDQKQLHECGIIYWQSDRPHILCIMTSGNEYPVMASYITEVTRIVQEAVLKEN